MILNKTEKANYNLLNTSFRNDLNIIKIHKSNSEAHELSKCKLCYHLLKEGKKFVTEARLINGNRPDVFDLSRGIAFELVETESDKSIELKKEKYGLIVVKLNAVNVLETKQEEMYKLIS